MSMTVTPESVAAGQDASAPHDRRCSSLADLHIERRALGPEGQRRPPRMSIVIPTLNEARNLPHVFATLPADIHEVIVVDGHSTDDTIAVTRALRPDARILTQPGRGKGDALRYGFNAATGDLVVMLDADGSTSGSEIPRFVAALQSNADLAKGTRFAPGGGSGDITRSRHLGNRALNLLVNALYGTRFTDLCYGYNAFWRRCLVHIDIDCDGFEVETLINIRAAKAGLRIREVPSYEAPRLHGTSNLNAWRDGRRVLTTIVREWTPRRTRAARDARRRTVSPAARHAISERRRSGEGYNGLCLSSEKGLSSTCDTVSLGPADMPESCSLYSRGTARSGAC